MKAGAVMNNMGFACGTWPTFKTPASPMAWSNRLDMALKANSWFFTNAVGDRWMIEKPLDHPHRQWLRYGDIDWTQAADNTGYLDIPNWLIFDESVRTAGPLIMGHDGLQVLPAEMGGCPDGWSSDNSREIEEGTIMMADTFEELADLINAFDADGARVIKEKLVATAERFNGFAEAGVDEDFGRAAQNMAPLVTPPFYAIKLSPCVYSTAGGPEKNGHAQILDPFGEPIPHLFACGTFAHTHGHLYTTFGANIAENIAFGRIAGQAAAATEPWE